MTNIFTILLNWNGREDTLACLESLAACTCDGRHSVVVVDNGSSDGSQALIRQRYPDAVLLQNTQNLGFTGGNNVGIEYALAHGADFVYLLNNDTVVDPGMLRALHEAAVQNPQAGIFGAKIYFFNQPDLLWYAGAEWSWERAEFGHVACEHTDNHRDWETLKPTDYACGCAMFVRAEVFRRIGFLDPRFFILWEEADFCYRARRAGYQCLFVPRATLWHKISSTFGSDDRSPRYLYFWWRNRLLWMERNLGLADRVRVLPRLLGEVATLLRWRISPRAKPTPKNQARGALRGVGDYLARRFHDCPAWLKPAPRAQPAAPKGGSS